MVFCRYHVLSPPLAQNTNVPILDNKWMPLTAFAIAIGVKGDRIKEKFPHLRVHNVLGLQQWQELVNLEEDAQPILMCFWMSLSSVQSAMKLFKSYCKPRKGDRPLAVPSIAAAAPAPAPVKKRDREEDEPLTKLLGDHFARVENLVKHAFEMMEDKAVKAITAMPEFRQRVSRIAAKEIEEEKVLKRRAMEQDLQKEFAEMQQEKQ